MNDKIKIMIKTMNNDFNTLQITKAIDIINNNDKNTDFKHEERLLYR